MASFHYLGLTPDAILHAVESYGVYPISGLTPLNSYENRVYQFRAEDNRNYVVKFYRPDRWSKAQIQEEHDFCFELQQNGLNVSAPLSFSGQSVLQWQDYWFCLYPSYGGRMFEADDFDHLERFGQVLGQLHQISERSAFEHRETINIQSDIQRGANTLQQSELVPNEIKPQLNALIEQALQTLNALHLPNFKNIRLHGDCHIGNILAPREDEPALLIDFDDCCTGPAVQDIWMMLSGDKRDKFIQLDAILEGYQHFCEFDHAQLILIEPLRLRRMVNHLAWVCSRWSDPSFPKHFYYFEEVNFWQQQLVNIQQQIQQLNETNT